MFNLTAKFLLAVSILMIGGITAASAQISDDMSVKVNVPNAFVLRDKTFPAGEYTIKRTDNSVDSPSLLVLKGAEGEVMIFDTISARAKAESATTQLVFDRVGGQLFLTKIWVEGDAAGYEIARTKTERKLVAAGVPVEKYTINYVRAF